MAWSNFDFHLQVESQWEPEAYVGPSSLLESELVCLAPWDCHSSLSFSTAFLVVALYLHGTVLFCSVQLLSCIQLFVTPMECSMPDLPVHHQLPEFTQTHVHWVGDAIQTSHPLLSPSPPALSISQNHGLLKWVSSSHQVAKLLEFQLQHQSFQWTPRTDLL